MPKIALLFISLISFLSFAQRPNKGKVLKTGEIFGTIVDSITDESLGYATVIAFNQPENEMVKGVVTGDNGNFSLSELPIGNYNLKISFIGYNTKIVEGIKLSADVSTYNTKNIVISPLVLNTVEVIGDKPIVTYEIDKKIINVEDQINTDGQTAVEVLENFPSISVSADGTVSLRGSSSFTLLIDGIPTAMDASDALATIPASTIKEIEIITNPSAKFDAEGTSGVINIITKKNKLQGMSSLINLSAGRFENYNGDVAFNIKKNKFTFDLSGNINQRHHPRRDTIVRTTTFDSVTNILKSNGIESWKMNGWGAGGGIMWNPNNSHVLSVKGNFRSTLMSPYNDRFYQNYDNDSLLEEFYTDQHNSIDFINSTTSLYYQYNIKRNKDHNISFKAIANMTYVRQSDTTLSFTEDNTITAGNLYTEIGPSNSYRFNLDYKLPLKKGKKIEAGVQSQFGKSGDIGKNYTYNLTTEVYDFNKLFSSDVDYVRDVHAAYSMFSGKYKKFGYQVGLRVENTYREITSTTSVDFTKINRLDWFPSAHFSYSFENKSQVLLSYSRRIERPRSYYFEPFITWEGPYNVRTGNPNLLPEYIGAFELSFIKPIKKKGFFSLEGYYKNSVNSIKRLTFVYEPGVLISQPYNIGSSNSFGTEASFNYRITDWWKINAGINGYLFNLSGNLNEIEYNVNSFNYSGRITNTFSKNGWILQLVSRYRSGSVTAQGESKGSFTQDVSIKKSFNKKRFALTLQGRNILGTARNDSFSLTENVYITEIARPLSPQISLTLSIKLNNYKKVQDRGEQMDDF
jgi:outer membrane receptor protein involved in Fe transport